MNGYLRRRLEREINGWDDVVDDPRDDWADPHGIPRPRIDQEGPVIDGFFDREKGED